MMDMKGQQQMIDQMVEFQKKTVKNSFNTFELIQRRSGNMMELLMKQYVWYSEKYKEMIQDSSETFRNNCERFYRTMESQLEKAGHMVCMK